jgi:hypothetical protein
LIRAFFGHTRFATSSKASFDGTHPHLWSERRVYKIYHGSSKSYRMGVENCECAIHIVSILIRFFLKSFFPNLTT